jgi:drug/metabolite transporter (DMT)-like permease
MDPRAVGLVLAAAGFHAAWNLGLHRNDDRLAAVAVASLTGGAILLPALVLRFPSGVLPLVALSAAGETAYGVTLAASYALGALSVAYPIGRGTAPLLVTLAALVVLRQTPTPGALAGACALAAGLSLIASRADARRGAVLVAMLVGVCIATYSVVDARAVRTANPLAYLSLVLLLTGLVQVIILRGNLGRLRRAARPGALIGVGTIVSYVLVLFAFTFAAAGRVATLREIAVLLGVLAARERPGLRGWAGAALVVAGAILAGI